MTRIFISRTIPDSGLELLHEAFGEEAVDMWPEDRVIPRAELLKRVQGIDAMLAILTEKIDGELLDAAGPQLRIVANMAVGYDNIDVPAASQRGIPVSNTPGVLTETTADLAFSLIFAASRRLGESERFLRSGEWTAWSPTFMLGYDVYGKTLGIFGFGRIGQAVARRAQGFGMRVIYYSTECLSPTEDKKLGVTCVDRETLLRESDIVSVHCPLTPDTRHAFSDAEFRAMKKTAVFVNTSRGPVVDEAALARALKNKEIFSAGIDVFEQEPKVHPELLDCETAVLVPHIGSATLETRSAMANMAAENIIARLNNKRPPNCLNPEVL